MRRKIVLALCLSLLGTSLLFSASKININTASATELDTLPGIGPSIANLIIAARPFDRIEDITRVKGIGEVGSKTYNDLKNLITVGDDTDEPVNEDENGEDEEVADSSGEASSHSAARELSNFEAPKRLEIGAGRPRVTAVNTPLQFEAVLNVGDGRERSLVTWSFGDGTSKRGRLAHHAYAAPGTYVVVATAKQGQDQAAARTTVEVFAPELKVAETGGGIKLSNLSKHEVNLGGWNVAAGGKNFVLAPETIVLPGASITIAAAVSGLPVNSGLARLHYPDGQLAVSSVIPSMPVKTYAAAPAVPVYQLAAVGAETLQSTSTIIELRPPESFWARWFKKILPGQ